MTVSDGSWPRDAVAPGIVGAPWGGGRQDDGSRAISGTSRIFTLQNDRGAWYYQRVGPPLRKTDAHYTYGDYRHWPLDQRWELIRGTAWNMSPAPFDVLLPSDPDQAENEVDTVVQPDLSVFCDPARLTDAGARGAPDLVVEILVKTGSVASAVLEGFRVDVEALFTL